MTLSRVVAARLAAAAFSSLLALPAPAAAQAAPKLSKTQRTTLEALVTAVDGAAAGGPATSPQAPLAAAAWTSHVLRASDGSHYVALRADVPGLAAAASPVTMYVRLAPRRIAGAASAPPRSAVMEWLRGLRSEPLPMRAARSTTVNIGEMPVGGTAAAVGDVAAGATTALRLVELQRERQARLLEEDAARRRASLEHPTDQHSDLLPFEDFDLAARTEAGPGGALRLLRGITAGPGHYDVFIAWAPAAARGVPHVYVLTHRLELPAAPPAFGLSDIVIAEAVTPLPTRYPATQQAGHPYAFGTFEVSPAAGNRLSSDGTLGVMYQVVNPTGSGTGKPDVEVSFSLFRLRGNRSEVFGRLETQRHDASSVAKDFDVALGHPLFGAVRAPLSRFPRGRYRLEVSVFDRLSGGRVVTDTIFDVIGSAAHLLREAPAAGQPFRREQLLDAGLLSHVVDALRPPAPSDALDRALRATAAGRFAEVVQVAVSLPAERPVAQVLLGLALYGLGDSPRAVIAQLTQARNQGAPDGAVHLVLGAALALLPDDAAAVRAWDDARDGRIPDHIVAPFLVDAYLRQGDLARAEAMARAVLDAQPGDRRARRALVSTYIASGRFPAALALLDLDAPGAHEADMFLGLHALFAAHVADAPVPDLRKRFATLAGTYLDNRGAHAELVQEWLALLNDLP